MYRIAVCDDQPAAAEKMEQNLKAYMQKHAVDISASVYLSPDMLLADIENGTNFDIIFLDIEMPMINGLDVIRELTQLHVNSLVIIVSSHIQYSLEAIELKVFRYLMKNCEWDMFERYLDAALREVEAAKQEHYISISAKQRVRVNCGDILYCYKDSKSSVLVTKEEEIKERKTLQVLLSELQELCDYFIMIERGYIVNLHHVERISGNKLYLKNKSKLPIGNTYEKEVKSTLNQFWRKRI